MIVAFIGYVGQAQEALRSGAGAGAGLVGQAALAMGAIGACVATWFTFLPSFVFILAGGPLIEATHGKLGLTAPLKAITAAVVGVIATLALLFLVHVLWPSANDSMPTAWVQQLDWQALAIVSAAALALFRFKTNVMLVIAACALAGLLMR